MTNETAILVLSGKALGTSLPFSALDAIRNALERETLARGVAVSRRVATLAPSNFSVAPEFLKAGFEVIPADDEDVQATAVLFNELASPNPTPEILFALGLKKPIELLRLLSGKTRRILLTTDDVSPDLEENVEGFYNLRALLADVEIDWDTPDAAFLDRSIVPAAPETALDPVAAPEDNLCALAPETGPDALELNAPAWNAALEEVLLENDALVCPAYFATDRISDRFPELPNFFLTQPEEFRRLLSKNILMIEENSTTYLYHKTHPDCRPLTASDALGTLTLGSVSKPASKPASKPVSEPVSEPVAEPVSEPASEPVAATVSEPVSEPVAATVSEPAVNSSDPENGNFFKDAQTFAENAARARLVANHCRWCCERALLRQEGAYFQEEIAPRDREFKELAREHNLYLWAIAYQLSPHKFEEAAKCYDIAAEAFELFDRILATPSDDIDEGLFHRAAQATANAQCGLKSLLARLNVAIYQDGVQRAAYELLREHCCRRRNVCLANFQRNSYLNFEETLALADEIAKLAQQFDALKARAKTRRELEGKIDFHLKKIADAPDSEHDWNKIVEAATELCNAFHKPVSSLWFRERLRDYVDQIPEETQTTEVFGRIVQEIDLARLREEEAAFEMFEPQEISHSPAVQAVRDRYAGTQVVFVGGTPQPHMQARLEKYFGVRVFWTAFGHGDSLDRYGSFLRDDETRLFLIYIPWCSHKHSEEFTVEIKNAGKDYVRHRKGTNPEQIAQAICRQLRLLPESEF